MIRKTIKMAFFWPLVASVVLFYFPSHVISACGYESCNKEKPGMVNIHVVPHTHDDVGWLITVDQYYYRSVQFILDSVIPELEADPSKRFIYVETAFFSRWYDEQSDSMRHRVKLLVDQGRLEFILGGWCMNDEASTHYSAIIDQHKLGFEYLRKNFGECGRPRIGWQIDPFGHSREQTSIFAQFGFDGLFFGRLDYQDKNHRQDTVNMETVWRGSPNNIGNPADLFTGVLPNGYNPPKGFCFDVTCDNIDSKMHDNPKLHDYNIEEKVDMFLVEMTVQALYYKTNHLIITMGSDFNYVNAHMWYKELDKLIKYVNARQDVGSKFNLIYSTPSCYLKAVNNDLNTWTVKNDDFFPYANRPHSFWTGYFTSRPAFKYYARYVNSFSQSLKQMDAFAKLDNTHESRQHLLRLAQVLGVAQHHDAISGTAKQAVDYDYTQRLAYGVENSQSVVTDVYSSVLQKNKTLSLPDQFFCHYLNVSVCRITQGSNQVQVTMYNPLSWPVQHIVRLPVSKSNYTVLAPDGFTVIPSDVMPVAPTPSRLPGQFHAAATRELVFKADLPPLGMSTFFVIKKSTRSALKFSSEKKSQAADGHKLIGKYVMVEFDDQGRLKSMTDVSSVYIPLQQNYFYYKGFEGNNSRGEFQSSGAYIFRPQNNTPTPIAFSTWSGTRKGQVVQEAHQQFGDFVSQVIRVYEDKPYVEVEWTVGPIPIDDNIGKEIITRYSITNFPSNSTFYTDSNGREILERRVNYRPTWNFVQTEQVAGNYFPVNSIIAIKDQALGIQFTVLTDRSQGGTSLNDGDVELMLHRRLLVDDGYGVAQALNESGTSGKGLVVRGKHYLLLSTIKKAPSVYRKLAKEVFMTPQPTFSNAGQDPKRWTTFFNTTVSFLKKALPANIHLLSLEQFQHTGPVPSQNGTYPYLVRFEHFYEAGEDPELSKPVSFDIKSLFTPFVLNDVHELTLGANQPIEQLQRLHWRTMHNPSGNVNPKRHLKGTVVTLGPMDIVTLQANVKL